MNNFNYVIKKWDVTPQSQRPDFILKQIKHLFRNKELIEWMGSLINHILEQKDKEYYLLFLRKTILQIQRVPDPIHFKAFEDEYRNELLNISNEQLLFDPVKWIEAEVEFVRHTNNSQLREAVLHPVQVQTEMPTNSKKDWLTFSEVMEIFHLSNASLRKRIAEGCPVSKVGAKLLFKKDLIYDWVVKGVD